MLDSHTTETSLDDEDEGQGGLLMCSVPVPPTSCGGNYAEHATGKDIVMYDSNDMTAGTSSVTGTEDCGVVCTPPPRPTDENSSQSRPVALGDHVGGASGGGGDEGIPEPMMKRTPKPGLSRNKVCSYSKRGVCAVHGPGAKEHWRPIRDPVPGPDGKLVTRQYYWVCPKEEIGPRGGILRQSRLSFGGMRRSSTNDEGNNDDSRCKNTLLDSTTTGGT